MRHLCLHSGICACTATYVVWGVWECGSEGVGVWSVGVSVWRCVGGSVWEGVCGSEDVGVREIATGRTLGKPEV